VEGALSVEFEVEIIVPDPARDPELGDTLVEGFRVAGYDLVVHQDLAAGSAELTLSLSADDAASASETAIETLRGISSAQRLVPTAIHVAVATEPAPQAA
jgi:hypothetical protein